MKKEYNLHQHTPIIHFKPDSSPIRGTELKPAFDKFMAKKEGIRVDQFKKNYPYKVNIIYSNVEKKEIKNRYPLYFGNMGQNKKYEVRGDIVVEFFAFEDKVLNTIDNYFGEFLLYHNFGTRGSKGFGSFTIEGSECFNTKVYSFESQNWQNDIDIFYKFLRQGINQKGRYKFYAKPLIFRFACEKGIRWEKKRIKEFINDNYNFIDCNGNYKIVRDLLGLSTFQNWRQQNAKITKRGLARYPSPIKFKPINNKVYFFVEDWYHNNKLHQKTATLKIEAKGRSFNLEVAKLDINEFLEYVYNQKNQIDNLISVKDDTNIYNSLKHIFNTLRIENG
jgi:hypothetical protein